MNIPFTEAHAHARWAITPLSEAGLSLWARPAMYFANWACTFLGSLHPRDTTCEHFVDEQRAMDTPHGCWYRWNHSQAAAIREERIRVVKAREGENVRSIATRSGAVWTAEQTAVANHVTDSEPLKEGYVIKVAVAEPYEGRNK